MNETAPFHNISERPSQLGRVLMQIFYLQKTAQQVIQDV